MFKPLNLLKAAEAKLDTILETHNPFNLVPNEASYIAYDAAQQLAILLPNHDTYYATLTSRNYPFLSHEEQDIIRQARIGIVGQGTVGGNLAIAMARYGFEHFRICDHDIFDVSNLNRQPSDLLSVGLNKAEAVAAQISRINPFAQVEVTAPVDESNLADFLDACDIIVSALDNAQLILRLNQAALEQKIPVLLGTDLGSRVLLDVFDYRHNKKLLNGRASFEDINLPYLVLVSKIIGVENMPVEMLEAILMRIEGKIDYFAQTTVSANLCSSMLIEATIFVLLNRPILANTHIDIIDTIALQPYKDQRQSAWLEAKTALNAIIEAQSKS